MIIYLLIFRISAYVTIELNKQHLHYHHLQSGVSMNNYNNLQYSGSLKIGGQEIQLLFDTGSSVFWVFSTNCSNCKQNSPAQYSRKNFDCLSSTDCRTTEESYKVQYGSGQIVGNKAFDQIQMDNLTIKNYQFLIVTSQQSLENLQADGICGLGLQKMSGFESIIDALYDKKLIEKRQFAFFLNTIPNNVNNASVLLIGGYDRRYMSSEPQYTNINSNKWSVDVQKIVLDDSPLVSGISALIDTGTSLLVFPSHEFSELLSKLRDQYKQFCQYSQYQIKCSCPEGDFSKFPQLEFYFQGFSLILKPQDYITIDVSVCVLGITKSANDDWILGDAFLRKFVTIFDVENKRVGFAQLAEFDKQSKQIQMNDYLYIFKVVLVCICVAIALIWIIRQVSCLGEASHELMK